MRRRAQAADVLLAICDRGDACAAAAAVAVAAAGGPTVPRHADPDRRLITFTPSGTGGANSLALTRVSSDQNTLVLSLEATSVTDLYGIAFDLRFPASVLAFDQATEGTFLDQNGTVDTSLQVAETPSGTLVIGLTRLGQVRRSHRDRLAAATRVRPPRRRLRRPRLRRQPGVQRPGPGDRRGAVVGGARRGAVTRDPASGTRWAGGSRPSSRSSPGASASTPAGRRSTAASHIGNLRTFLWEDVLLPRARAGAAAASTQVMNITDVEDKIIAGAAEGRRLDPRLHGAARRRLLRGPRPPARPSAPRATRAPPSTSRRWSS